MTSYAALQIGDLLRGNRYPGRGIILGKSADGKKAVCAYFIMGRSANSRNRVFALRDGALFTEPFDAAKVEDPSLIIYAAVRTQGSRLVVTNGDQTDTIVRGLREGKGMRESLQSRAFEPDAPNYTPRISGMLTFGGGDVSCQMSILKSADASGSACMRVTYDLPALPGIGYFIHTYAGDGNPLPSFSGDPERVALGGDLDSTADEIWAALDAENRISLYVRTVDLETNEVRERVINKYGA